VEPPLGRSRGGGSPPGRTASRSSRGPGGPRRSTIRCVGSAEAAPGAGTSRGTRGAGGGEKMLCTIRVFSTAQRDKEDVTREEGWGTSLPTLRGDRVVWVGDPSPPPQTPPPQPRQPFRRTLVGSDVRGQPLDGGDGPAVPGPPPPPFRRPPPARDPTGPSEGRSSQSLAMAWLLDPVISKIKEQPWPRGMIPSPIRKQKATCEKWPGPDKTAQSSDGEKNGD